MRETFHRLVTGDSSSCPWIPDGSVSLVVTSPPYPMIAMWDPLFGGRSGEVRRALEAGDGPAAFRLMHQDLDRTWSEVARVLRPGGLACVNIGDATRSIGGRFQLFSNHARILDRFSSLGFDILPLVLWRKPTNAPNKFMGSGMLPAGAYVTLEHEHILVMRKGGKREFRTEEEKRVRRESAFFWEERNVWFSDTWDFKGARQSMEANPARPGGARQSMEANPARLTLRDRSAAFPFELPWRLINMFSVRGDTVLDPFLGTGTTVYAAMASGRNSLGVDVDPSLIAAAVEEAPRMGGPLNRLAAGRLTDHLAFVEDCGRAGRELKHANGPHGFPVMTAQETGLLLESISDIALAGHDTIRVSHETTVREPARP
jgi:modification methylase